MAKIKLKSKREINQLKEGGDILVRALMAAVKLAKTAENGDKVSTWDLDKIVEEEIRKKKAEPAFLNYSEGGDDPFPASLCTSINNEIVHGIPQKDLFIQKGDLVKLDLGVKFRGLFTDAAVTVLIGNYNDERKKIMEVTRKCLEIGLEQIYPGSRLGNYGNAVEKYVLLKGFYVVKGLVGHGVGYAVHEPPQVLNYGYPGEGLVLEEGMVLALEPMVNQFSDEIELADNDMTFITRRGGLSAHFECTVAVTKKGHQILTDWFKYY